MRRRFALVIALAAASLPVCGWAQSSFPDRPQATDPEAYDAVGVFSRLCLTTRGDRARALAIIGTDNTVEKLDQSTLNGLEGQQGGIGWVLRMPLGDRILVEFAPDGTCVVRAPRVNALALETGLANLLDQISASGQFKYRKRAENSKLVNKIRFHLIEYSLVLPDLDQTAQIGVATNDNPALIQGVLRFLIPTGKP